MVFGGFGMGALVWFWVAGRVVFGAGCGGERVWFVMFVVFWEKWERNIPVIGDAKGSGLGDGFGERERLSRTRYLSP